jgi:hypothetical protein
MGRSPTLQVTTPLLAVPPPSALTKVAPAGKVSVTLKSSTGSVPVLVTEIVYVTLDVVVPVGPDSATAALGAEVTQSAS